MSEPTSLVEVRDWFRMPAGWELFEPSSVAVDSNGRIVVVHRGEHPLLLVAEDGRVIEAIADEQFPKTFMVEPDGTPFRDRPLHWLHGLHVDRLDNIWVTEIGRNVVLKLTPSGELALTLGTDGQAGDGLAQFDQPTDVAVAPSGEIYVADGYGNSRVVRFAADGTYLTAWGRLGTAPGEFNTPHGIAVGPDGNVFVAERLNNRVQVFDPDGRAIAAWPDLPSADAIRFGPDGNVYLGSGHGTRTFQRLSPDGGRRDQLATRAEIGYPHAFSFDPEGNLFAADPIEHTIRKFRWTGPAPATG